MTIAFIHPHKSFLQNPKAYADFFSSYGIRGILCLPEEARRIRADVAWHFLGTDTRKDNSRITIHEYASSSMPPFHSLKNRLKKWVNVRPDFRIFNNRYVSEAFSFSDGVPSGIREYGIMPIRHMHSVLPEKKYDFLYLGTVGKERRLEKLFNFFTIGGLCERSLLVLSQDYRDLARQFRNSANIHFKGPVPYEEVRSYVQQCRYGINFMPDVLPFNSQISAKLLDYSAAGIPVITTDYPWVREFQDRAGGSFFYLKKDLSNLNWEGVSQFHYQIPDLQEWTWEKQIRKSGVLEFLKTRFDQLDFERKIN